MVLYKDPTTLSAKVAKLSAVIIFTLRQLIVKIPAFEALHPPSVASNEKWLGGFGRSFRANQYGKLDLTLGGVPQELAEYYLEFWLPEYILRENERLYEILSLIERDFNDTNNPTAARSKLKVITEDPHALSIVLNDLTLGDKFKLCKELIDNVKIINELDGIEKALRKHEYMVAYQLYHGLVNNPNNTRVLTESKDLSERAEVAEKVISGYLCNGIRGDLYRIQSALFANGVNEAIAFLKLIHSNTPVMRYIGENESLVNYLRYLTYTAVKKELQSKSPWLATIAPDQELQVWLKDIRRVILEVAGEVDVISGVLSCYNVNPFIIDLVIKDWTFP